MAYAGSISNLMMKYLDMYLLKSKDTAKDFIAPDEPYEYQTYLVDKGWVEYMVMDNIFWIRTAFNINNDTMEHWDNIKEIAKSCGCEKIQFTTKRNPKVFERRFGCKTIQHKLEYQL